MAHHVKWKISGVGNLRLPATHRELDESFRGDSCPKSFSVPFEALILKPRQHVRSRKLVDFAGSNRNAVKAAGSCWCRCERGKKRQAAPASTISNLPDQ